MKILQGKLKTRLIRIKGLCHIPGSETTFDYPTAETADDVLELFSDIKDDKGKVTQSAEDQLVEAVNRYSFRQGKLSSGGGATVADVFMNIRNTVSSLKEAMGLSDSAAGAAVKNIEGVEASLNNVGVVWGDPDDSVAASEGSEVDEDDD